MLKLVITGALKFPRPFDNSFSENIRLTKRTDASQRMTDYIDKIDAIIGGLETMRAYPGNLPSFPNEETAAYNYRLTCAKLTNIYRDTVESLASKPFEEEIRIVEGENKSIPEAITDFAENVDGRGNNLTVFASTTFFNGLNNTHDWILIDYPVVERGTIRNLEEQKKAGIRPFWNHVLARNVYEVRNAVVGGNERLNYIRVFEPAANGVADRFTEYEMIDGKPQLTRWEKNTKGEYVKIDQRFLTIDVIPMVPFIAARRDGDDWSFDPALRSAAELQVTLFRQESSLEFASEMTAFPMLSANGVKPDTDPVTKKPRPLAVGPSCVLYAPADGNGRVGSWTYVEISANSLTFLQSKIDKTKTDLRELGKQPLTAQSGNLTVITTAVAAGKAKSFVGQCGLLLKDAIENALVITCKWFGRSIDAAYDPEVSVYDGYDDFGDRGAEVTAIHEARKERDISQETYWQELKRRGILSAEFDPDKERALLLKELPGDNDETDPGDLNPRTPTNPQPEGNDQNADDQTNPDA